MILVDSSVWIDFFRGTVTPQVDALDRLLGEELVAIGDLMMSADLFLLFGIEHQLQRFERQLIEIDVNEQYPS